MGGAWTFSFESIEASFHTHIHLEFRKFGALVLITEVPIQDTAVRTVHCLSRLSRLTSVIVFSLKEKEISTVAFLDDRLVWSDSHRNFFS